MIFFKVVCAEKRLVQKRGDASGKLMFNGKTVAASGNDRQALVIILPITPMINLLILLKVKMLTARIAKNFPDCKAATATALCCKMNSRDILWSILFVLNRIVMKKIFLTLLFAGLTF